jgi:hypothetical protein
MEMMSDTQVRALSWAMGLGLLGIVVWGFHSDPHGPTDPSLTPPVGGVPPLVTQPDTCYSQAECD